MTNEQLLEKMSKDMQMRNFSKYTYYAYMHKGKEIIKYFNKPMEEVTTEELRNFLNEAIENNTKVYYETTDNIETGKTKITKFHF